MASVPLEDCVKLPLIFRTLPGPKVRQPLLVKSPVVVNDWPPHRLKLPPASMVLRPLRLEKVVFRPLSVTLAAVPVSVKFPQR
jgi:hypothetical protein